MASFEGCAFISAIPSLHLLLNPLKPPPTNAPTIASGIPPNAPLNIATISYRTHTIRLV